jgi:hypothetical protein
MDTVLVMLLVVLIVVVVSFFMCDCLRLCCANLGSRTTRLYHGTSLPCF